MIDVVEALPGTRAGNYIAGQLIKSCHSPTFNYGETQAAESREDFIHKLGVVLKELRWFLKNSILSFPCKRESIVFKNLWISTFVGMTINRSLLLFHSPELLKLQNFSDKTQLTSSSSTKIYFSAMVSSIPSRNRDCSERTVPLSRSKIFVG